MESALAFVKMAETSARLQWGIAIAVVVAGVAIALYLNRKAVLGQIKDVEEKTKASFAELADWQERVVDTLRASARPPPPPQPQAPAHPSMHPFPHGPAMMPGAMMAHPPMPMPPPQPPQQAFQQMAASAPASGMPVVPAHPPRFGMPPPSGNSQFGAQVAELAQQQPAMHEAGPPGVQVAPEGIHDNIRIAKRQMGGDFQTSFAQQDRRQRMQ